MQNPGLDESQAGIKIPGRNINSSRFTDDTTLTAESEEELKNILTRVKEKKSWLKTQHSENRDHRIWFLYFVANERGKSGSSDRFSLLRAPESLQMVTAAMKLKHTCSLEGKV